MHIHAVYAVVAVGVVVVNALGGVAAGGVEGNFVFAAVKLAAAPLLIHAAEDVEELAYAFLLGVAGEGVHFYERHPHKS